MNLKAKRLIRTPYSEQYALFDLNRTDEHYDPLSVGKLDLHYTQHGIYGTLLFWAEVSEQYAWDDVLREAELLLAEFQAPMGISGEYAIEIFSPTLKQYEVLSNIEEEETSFLATLDSDELAEEEIEVEDEEYHSIWPGFASQTSLNEGDSGPEDDIGDEADDDSEEDFAPRPSRRLGIHGQPEWVDN